MCVTLTNSAYANPNKKEVFELISHSVHQSAICIFNVHLTLRENSKVFGINDTASVSVINNELTEFKIQSHKRMHIIS